MVTLLLGHIGMNDAKGIDVAQCIWPWGRPTTAQKQPKNAFSVLFGCFWAFVGQPHGHIRWATSMPFASFNPTNPRTNLRNFREKILRIGDFEKWAFFESAILNFFFEKKKFFFCFIPMKISPNLYGRMDGSKFWCFPWFPENSLLCVILRYTVYIGLLLISKQNKFFEPKQKSQIHIDNVKLFCHATSLKVSQFRNNFFVSSVSFKKQTNTSRP